MVIQAASVSKMGELTSNKLANIMGIKYLTRIKESKDYYAKDCFLNRG